MYSVVILRKIDCICDNRCSLSFSDGAYTGLKTLGCKEPSVDDGISTSSASVWTQVTPRESTINIDEDKDPVLMVMAQLVNWNFNQNVDVEKVTAKNYLCYRLAVKGDVGGDASAP